MKKPSIKNLKALFRSKTLIVALIFTFGLLIGAFAFKIYENYRVYDISADFYDKSNDTLVDFMDLDKEFDKKADIDKVEHEFNEYFKKQQKIFSRIINNRLTRHDKNIHRSFVTKHENENSVSYKLELENFKSEEVEVEINEDYLVFRGLDKKKDDKRLISSEAQFLYSFSLPEYDKNINPEITRNNNSVVVKFFIDNN